MTNQEKAALLRSAASALEHGRVATARKKLAMLWQETELYELLRSDIYTDAWEYESRVQRIGELVEAPLLIDGPCKIVAEDAVSPLGH